MSDDPTKWFSGQFSYPGDPDWQGGQPVSKPTARELLRVGHTEEREMYHARLAVLASRVEKVLALHVEWWGWPGGESRCATCEKPWPCPTIRILNGEEV